MKIPTQSFLPIFRCLLVRYLLCLPFLLIAPVCCAEEVKPNVLLIMVDDLNGEVGCYGSKSAKTPHLDSFAATAVRFTQAYCQAPLCNPSRTSMLTGLRPETIGVIDNNTHFRWKRPGCGHPAAAVPRRGLAHGGLREDLPRRQHARSRTEPRGTPVREVGKPLPKPPDANAEESPASPAARAPTIHGTPGARFAGGDTAAGDGKFSRAAVAAMKRMKDEPFFLAVGFKKPHAPLFAPEKYFALHSPRTDDLPPSFRYPDEPPVTYLPAAALRPNFDLFGLQRKTPRHPRRGALRARRLCLLRFLHRCAGRARARRPRRAEAARAHHRDLRQRQWIPPRRARPVVEDDAAGRKPARADDDPRSEDRARRLRPGRRAARSSIRRCSNSPVCLPRRTPKAAAWCRCCASRTGTGRTLPSPSCPAWTGCPVVPESPRKCAGAACVTAAGTTSPGTAGPKPSSTCRATRIRCRNLAANPEHAATLAAMRKLLKDAASRQQHRPSSKPDYPE